MAIKKVYRTRKKCVHNRCNQKRPYVAVGGVQECYAKLSTWKCMGVSCGWYKEVK